MNKITFLLVAFALSIASVSADLVSPGPKKVDGIILLISGVVIAVVAILSWLKIRSMHKNVSK